jgi:hypothetical protein
MGDWVTTRPPQSRVVTDTSTASWQPRPRADNSAKSPNTRKSSKKEELIKADRRESSRLAGAPKAPGDRTEIGSANCG